MKIHVPSIPEEGKTLTFDQEEGWFREFLIEKFSDFYFPNSPASGEIQIFRTQQNVSIHGRLTLEIQPDCDRCAQNFSIELEVPLVRHLAPFFLDPEKRGEEGDEVELNEEDMEFSSYHGEEIDLDDLIAEEIILSLPMRFLCREDCQGLCSQCGTNLNEKSCSCEKREKDSPFAALKDLKLPTARK